MTNVNFVFVSIIKLIRNKCICLSKVYIFDLFYKLRTTFLAKIKYKYINLEHLFAENNEIMQRKQVYISF